MILKLTRNQMKQLKPLFDKATRASERGEKGVVLLQPFSPDDSPRYAGLIGAVFVKHELALQIYNLVNSNKRQIVKR